MNWEKKKLKDCCISIADGDHQPPPKSENGVPFVTIANIDGNNFDFSNTMFAPETYYNSLDGKRKAQIGDVLYSVVGSFGIPVLIKEAKKFVFQRHIAILRCNKDVLLPEYLYYTMLTRDFYMKADTVALGAAQRTISLTSLRNLEINVPPLELQERIVDKVRPYDDLIENNRRQIKLLEEAAERLYKEWFVDLRFPGWETTPITDGVPEGWKKYTFAEMVDIMSGGTPKTSVPKYYEGNIPFYSPKDSDGSFFAFDTQTHISQEGLDSCNSRYYSAGTVIITARGTVGKTTILAKPMAMNQSCYALKCDTLNAPYYLFFSLNQEVALLKGMANGGVFDTIIVKTFERIHIIFPTNGLVQKFEESVQPFMETIKLKMGMISSLSEARDRLLPKLMSGEIEL